MRRSNQSRATALLGRFKKECETVVGNEAITDEANSSSHYCVLSDMSIHEIRFRFASDYYKMGYWFYIYIFFFFFSSSPRVELQNSVRLLSCRSQQLLCQQYQRLRGSVWYKLPGIVIWIWDRSFWIMLLGYCFFTVERKRVEVTCRAIDTC